MGKTTIAVGMAAYDDYQGVAFSVQALRLYHPEIRDRLEIVVVDNHPDSEDGHMVRGLCSWIKDVPCRYLPLPDVVGTSVPRDTVFRVAQADVVLCMDSHVLIAPGALARTLDWLDAHPGCKDLLQGPLIYDDLSSHSTHFNAGWRDQMEGTWGTAWLSFPRFDRTLEKAVYDLFTVREVNGLARPFGLMAQEPAEVTGFPSSLPFPGHEQHLRAAGFVPAAEGDEPYEIPAQGLGLFACRREAWLGFNPEMRGFGGEEWYVHRKYRMAGQRCLSLPWLRWWHRFGRPGGVRYPLNVWNKVRNYVIGRAELGLPLDDVREHFVPHLMPQHEWDQLAADPAHPPEWPADVPRPGEIPPPVWKAHADGTWTATLPDGSPLPPQTAPAKAGGCGCDNKAKAPEPPVYPESVTLESLYEAAAGTPGDINEHAAKLRELASEADTVVEMVHRADVSTTALLAGQPRLFLSLSPNDSMQARALAQRKGQTAYAFQHADAFAVPVPECDLLFIDEVHSRKRVLDQFNEFAPLCTRRVVLHDTIAYGERGEDGGPGILVAVREFLASNPEWQVVYHARHNNGLMVLSRDPADRKALPPLWQQGWNVLKAGWKAGADVVSHYGPLAGTEAQARRLELCTVCPSRNGERCGECGCPLDKKTSWPTESCPLGSWTTEQEAPAA